MKNTVAAFIVFTLYNSAYSQSGQQVDNQKTFAKIFGYVRYFHPSDEASAVDWNAFAILGSSRVDKCTNSSELKAELNKLFLPIAPSLKIYDTTEHPQFNVGEITPPDIKKFKTVAWQHLGVGIRNGTNNIYNSARTNRPLLVTTATEFGSLTMHCADAQKYSGKEFAFSAKVRMVNGNGSGHLWVRVDKPDKAMGFFDNMDGRPITDKKWAVYSITGKIDKDLSAIYYGIFLKGNGELQLDSIVMKVKAGDGWETVYASNLAEDKVNEFPKSIRENAKGNLKQPGFTINTVLSDDEKKCVSIKSTDSGEGSGYKKEKHDLLFEKFPAVGEYINKDIGSGLSCIIPLALYGDDDYTYPVADTGRVNAFKKELASVSDSFQSGNDLYVRLAGLAISWNIFQHFYMYFDVAKTDWAEDLNTAITSAYHDKSDIDFQLTLQKLTAKLKDGHVSVSNESIPQQNYFLPVGWEWIENKLVITDVLPGILQVRQGDIVTHIDGIPAGNYYQSIEEHISAATKGWMEYRANREALKGTRDSEVNLTITTAQGITRNVNLKRSLNKTDYKEAHKKAETVKKIRDDIYYVNLDGVTDVALSNLMPSLEKCKSIIFDLRGYPTVEPELISHLITQKDTSRKWMRVPRIIYPDQENIAGFQEIGWELTPQKPHLNARIIFIVNGSAISYAESFMSFIEHYKLATIIGQPTAGTNGNVNPFSLPGGYSISWTGMKVLKHDGSQHHGIGIQPDILLNKTIRGVREGKDEFLDKAIEIATR